ncbi:MAG TPA: EAL domain-containing protein [Thermoleophilaceae bacterium]|nr:EAL domain-containing protein [Thermoleophilaceae bacterium]
MIGTSANGKNFDLLDPSQVNWREALEYACSNLDAIHPVFLPIVQLKERNACGYELLARFSGGPAAPPAMWFESAAKLGLTAPLERRIMRAGFATADKLPGNAFVSVNITAEALLSPQLQELFSQRKRYDNMMLEVSERDVQQPGVDEALTTFRAGGGRLAVDDIGSGFVNLRDVVTMKPAILKVDRQLVRGVDRDRTKSAIVDGLNRMATRLEIPLLAEGIETREELAELEGLGVPLGQGYLFGEPSPSFSG